jgi:hypothetical protein
MPEERMVKKSILVETDVKTTREIKEQMERGHKKCYEETENKELD